MAAPFRASFPFSTLVLSEDLCPKTQSSLTLPLSGKLQIACLTVLLKLKVGVLFVKLEQVEELSLKEKWRTFVK